MQNMTHAVMAQRVEPKDSADDFPTQPWATRALIEHVLNDRHTLKTKTCLEPACGGGHMAKVLKEYFKSVACSDAYSYGYGDVRDFLHHPFASRSVDWVITNPPFRMSEEFVLRALDVARDGVAIFARSVFIESVKRYRNLFEHTPPSKFAQFTERVPLIKGRLDKNASTATSYAWLVWEKGANDHPRLMWIPPCRRLLERKNDYDAAPARKPEYA
jgi:predicted RNA methylase